MAPNTAGTNFDALHPDDQLVRVKFINAAGLVENAVYLGLSGYLPTEPIFERGAKLVHKAEAKDYINQANDGATPNFVEVPAQ